MKNIELIIRIPEQDYVYIAKKHCLPSCDDRTLRNNFYEMVRKGIPLPEGHGRLGDLDKIWSQLKEEEDSHKAEFLKESNVIHESAMGGRMYGFSKSRIMVEDAPTIVEADKESKEV